jgi:hypothetical protein
VGTENEKQEKKNNNKKKKEKEGNGKEHVKLTSNLQSEH